VNGELRLSSLAGLVAGMALATLGFYEPLPIWLPLPLLALTIWRLRWSWLGRPAPRVPQLVKVGCLGALGAVLWASGRFGIGIDGMGAGFIVLLWSKLLEMRSVRDFHHTCAIALFVVALQLLSSQSLGQCLFALASILVLYSVLVHFHIVGDTASGWVDDRPWRTWRRALRSGATLVGQSLPFAIALFICLPRPPATGLNRPLATTGVTDALSPGSVAKVALDTTPAFRVDFAGAPPAPAECYWRGVILWTTDGETWGRGSSQLLREVPQPEPGAHGAVAYDVTLQPQNQRWIYLLDAPIGIERQAEGQPIFLPRVGAVFESPRVIVGTTRYHATALLGGVTRDDPGELDEVPVSPHSGHPRESRYVHINVDGIGQIDRRMRDLAEDLRRRSLGRDGRVDAERAIAETLDWFRANRFVYTLEPGEMGPNATATFLFERRRGFCEHYANAFGVLMRLMKVPARVVVGYYGGEINQLGGFMTVRQANAHAWDEVWVEGHGWRRVDATEVALALDAQGNPIPQDEKGDPAAFAGSRGTGGWAQRHLKWLLQRWDFAEAQWDRWALTYDQDSLSALQRALGLERLGAFGPALMLLGVCLPLLALLVLAMRRRRRATDPALAAYAAFCDRLARVGVARVPAEGPLDFARRAGAEFPEQREAIARIAGEYAELRYGPPQPPPQRRSSLARFASDVRSFKPKRRA
jgi:transglutaminase-like putative cysteine protease